MIRPAAPAAGLALALVAASACGGDDHGPAPPAVCAEPPCERLTDYGLFEGTGATQRPTAGVVPYAPISPLYSDAAAKHRFIKLPEGGTITYDNTGRWEFPVGTILIKTFAYPVDARDPSLGERLLETRLLIKQADAWLAVTYPWDAAQTQATLDNLGSVIPVDWIDAAGEARHVDYRVPDKTMCGDCHYPGARLRPIGPRTRQLNGPLDYGQGPENQIDHMAALGMFSAPPPPAAERPTITDYHDEAAPVADRARAYLEANCAHCHNNEDGRAESSGLFLTLENEDPASLGVCKRPFSAGGLPANLDYDVVPGAPAESILLYRVDSLDPEVKMPELPLTTIDPLAVALITQWIAEMPGEACDAP